MEHEPKSIVIDWQETLLTSDLPANAKYLGMYLRTFMNAKSDIAWPSLGRIEHETGLSRSTVCKYLGVLESAGWVTRERGSKGVNTRYHAHLPPGVEGSAPHGLSSAPHGLSSAPHGLSSAPHGLEVVRETDTNKQLNNQVINKGGKSKRFTPPSRDEVAEYCKERGNQVNPDQFIDHYTANGWIQGRGKPIKCWKAAVRTWERREGEFSGNGKIDSFDDPFRGAI